MRVAFRRAQPDDCALILSFIRALAEYEKMADQVVADESTLRTELFEQRRAEVIFPMVEGKEAGFALFFHNFSTFRGHSGLYLEDLFILPPYRGQGVGKRTLQELARIAQERGCPRLEWCCLKWNTPALDFYRHMGAVPLNDWVTLRLTDDALHIQAAVARITQMEEAFDALLAGSQAEDLVARLKAYYFGPLWRKDLELDEKGLLPPTLKRGVLSQDGLWNLFARD